MTQKLTQDRLKQLLSYDPETGEFTWKARPWLVGKASSCNVKFAGRRAGNLNKVSGYVFIYVDNGNYSAHRLAHLYMTGAWPVGEIDHKDSNRANNKWSNLRGATRQQNASNKLIMSTSQNGVKGVQLHRRRRHQRRPWSARICVNGHRKSLGYFASREEAHAAYVAAAEKVFGEFANRGVAS